MTTPDPRDELIRVYEAELKSISAYETCHTCVHYHGNLNKYCEFERCPDLGGRPHFEPGNKFQARAKEALAQGAEIKKKKRMGNEKVLRG